MTQPQPTPPVQPPPPSTGANRLRIGAIVAVAIAIAVIVWLIVKDDNGNKSGRSAPPATAASVDQLRSLERTVGHPVYWAGRRAGFTNELTQVSGGNVYIRYLPSGTSLGDPRPNFLTIGTYPTRKAFSVLKRQGRRRGNTTDKLDRGGIAVSSASRPQSVYFTYPGSNVQVEVYDPSASRARRLVLSGRVNPIR